MNETTSFERGVIAVLAVCANIVTWVGAITLLIHGHPGIIINSIVVGGGCVCLIFHIMDITPTRKLRGAARMMVLMGTGAMIEAIGIVSLAYSAPFIARFAGATPIMDALSRWAQ